jgi:hypothetical protein
MPERVRHPKDRVEEIEDLCADHFLKTLVDAWASATAFEPGLIDSAQVTGSNGPERGGVLSSSSREGFWTERWSSRVLNREKVEKVYTEKMDGTELKAEVHQLGFAVNYMKCRPYFGVGLQEQERRRC